MGNLIIILKSGKNKKLIRWIEMIVLFGGLPVLYFFDLIPFHKAIPLLSVFLVLFFILLSDVTFDRKSLGINGFKDWRPMLLRFLFFAIISIILVRIISPSFWFILPREKPFLWLMILLFYPVWSAFPQEFIYRTWFFYRYRDLIKNESLFFLINAALFSFSHIIFRNWLALILTFFGGLMFAFTYRKSNSLIAVFIEHMLYGNFIFTVGVGQYFYLPLTS